MLNRVSFRGFGHDIAKGLALVEQSFSKLIQPVTQREGRRVCSEINSGFGRCEVRRFRR